MKVNQSALKKEIDEILCYGVAEGEEVDLTLAKIMLAIKPLLDAVISIKIGEVQQIYPYTKEDIPPVMSVLNIGHCSMCQREDVEVSTQLGKSICRPCYDDFQKWLTAGKPTTSPSDNKEIPRL